MNGTQTEEGAASARSGSRWRDRLGFGERRWKKAPDEEIQPSKTVWDWLQLLIVPAILAVIAVGYNAAQASREHQREDRRIREDRAIARAAAQDAAVLAYFAQGRDLILRENLVASSPAAELARNKTLAIVHRLDGTRKAEIVRFLFEANLLARKLQILNLAEADLRHLNLAYARVPQDVSLHDAILRRARFDGTRLVGTDFTHADLQGASFRGALLGGVEFQGANLKGAVFDGARFGESSSSGTSFVGACLSDTSFVGAHFGPGTSFVAVTGNRVDFTRASGLERVESEAQQLTGVTTDDATGRWPHRTGNGATRTAPCVGTGPGQATVDLGG
jgi:uncharacterized protein YjbI with pentapeptide repeats